MSTLRNFCFNLLIGLFILSSAIFGTMIGSFPIFKADSEYLQLDIVVHLSQREIFHDYQQVMEYLLNPWNHSLKMSDFISSANGLEHFREVKNLFLFNNVIWIISLLIVIGLVYKKLLANLISINLRFLQILATIPIILTVCSLINFDSLFILMHKLLFRNNDWMFDPLKDPVIKILPDTFFMHCFILLVIIFEVMIGLLMFYRYKKAREN